VTICALPTSTRAEGTALPSADHWSFRPVTCPAVPDRSVLHPSWSRTPVDRFLLTRLEQAGLEPSPEADPRTLLRRLSMDLRGLPPSPEEVREFLADSRPDAWSRWIERFLATAAYGERWGRHWLDVAGYADSNGYFNADSDRPLAWKYRDYVVRSIRSDKPFDRFILEQIAGDELVGFVRQGDAPPAVEDALVPTHFLRNPPDGTGESDGNPLEVKVDQYTVLEGAVQLVGNAFLGVTLQCARCHDHKFEPVRQSDYYALQAVLRPAFDPAAWMKPQARKVELATRVEREKRAQELAAHAREVKTLEAAIAAVQTPYRRRWIEESLASRGSEVVKPVLQAFDAPEAQRTDAMKAQLKAHAALVAVEESVLAWTFPELKAALDPLKSTLERRKASAPAPIESVSILDEPAAALPVHHLLVRGNHANEGAEVGPGVPELLTGASLRFDQAAAARPLPSGTSGRRLALARWLTDPRHPLVARVWVNRVWKLHFGEGLVATADNLGRSGGSPSHPELLDWLASEFIRSGWSLKHLHRLILNSAAWRQSSRLDDRAGAAETALQRARQVDGSNRLLWHYPVRRLDAEALRDSMLAASGELDTLVGGPYTPIQADAAGQIEVQESTPGARRRSLYLQQRRTQPLNLLEVFDGPQPNPVCIQRNPSTVVLQSLSLLNSDFARRRAGAMATRLLAAEPFGPEARLTLAFELVTGRPPRPAEREASMRFLEQAVKRRGRSVMQAWTDFCQMLLAGNAAVYVD
jgi:hypothetical protein